MTLTPFLVFGVTATTHGLRGMRIDFFILAIPAVLPQARFPASDFTSFSEQHTEPPLSTDAFFSVIGICMKPLRLHTG